jgi:hypothetical protein
MVYFLSGWEELFYGDAQLGEVFMKNRAMASDRQPR